MKYKSHTKLGIRVGDKVKLWENGKPIEARVSGITEHHIVLVRPNGKLWCMAHKDFQSLRAMVE